jgi:hypothetical protein
MEEKEGGGEKVQSCLTIFDNGSIAIFYVVNYCLLTLLGTSADLQKIYLTHLAAMKTQKIIFLLSKVGGN